MKDEHYIRVMLESYLEAIDFTECGPDFPEEQQDAAFSDELEKQAEQECREFYQDNKHLLLPHWSASQAGHDFWLTRNGHGAGFWDRGLPNGETLSSACDAYGPIHIYADDGYLYSEGG